ncbi:MAG: 23S rRNA (uracil(1939)-C(5))-methyltransferase RlmD [Bacteroidales bacterium]|jgi:23S rRNA (uracil1939-C5)-methyltransferase
MKKQKQIIREGVTITSFAAEGNSLAHMEGKVLFVPFTAPGDVVDVRIVRTRRQFAEGVVERLVSPSPLRTAPFCAHFGTCGGCRWQHVPYEKQLEFKQQQVFDQLSRIGKLTLPPLLPILGSKNTTGYRNKLEFTFSHKGWIPSEAAFEDETLFSPALGFHVRGRFDRVLNIETCLLQEEPSNAIRRFVRNYALQKELSFFDLRQQTGFLRTLMIRNASAGQVMVVVVFAHDNPAAGENHQARTALLEALSEAFPQITSLYHMVNTKRNDSLQDLEAVHYAGKAYLTETMDGLQFRIGPKSFYQTNTHQAAVLYEKVKEFAALQGHETVYDLFTGTGTIALYLARHCRHVSGVEYVPEAIRDAEANARANGLTNSAFFTGDIKEVLTPEFVEQQGKPHVVVLDPPRAGVHPDVLKVLLQTAPERMVYVSCNPATQARDLALLQEEYAITHVQPIDMFPHTHHIENIVALERRNKKMEDYE